MMNTTTTKTIFLGLLLSAGTFAVKAQELPKVFGRTVKSVNPVSGKIRCATAEYEEYLSEKDPNRVSRAAFEQWLAPKVEEAKTKRLAARSTNATAAVRIIPVVVHVIHNGDALGTKENITDAQVLSQITVLNQDYRKMANTPGWNDNPVGADLEIEFRMAKVDPSGNATNGIHRVQMSRATWSNETAIDGTLKPATSWDPTRYFNIWVVDFGDSSDLLGYAQFPSTSGLGGMNTDEGAANTDGVVIGYKYFGSYDIYPQGNYDPDGIYRYGRTATHEIGHCLGLLHVCGDDYTCTLGTNDSRKDYCPDTPATNDYNYGCTPTDSCPNRTGADMIENYMDYTDDQCMNIFTQNQKDRVNAVLTNSIRRASLLTSTVWQDTASVGEIAALNGITLYPNPATSVVNISVQGNELPDAYVVYNSIGQTVAQAKVSSNANLAVNTSALNNGVYFIKIDKGSQSKTLKFVKN
nr:T9SS type A sorting domain-containing protein [uncultured Flavobacterium sp.]